jgi:hypothetical protein
MHLVPDGISFFLQKLGPNSHGTENRVRYVAGGRTCPFFPRLHGEVATLEDESSIGSQGMMRRRKRRLPIGLVEEHLRRVAGHDREVVPSFIQIFGSALDPDDPVSVRSSTSYAEHGTLGFHARDEVATGGIFARKQAGTASDVHYV